MHQPLPQEIQRVSPPSYKPLCPMLVVLVELIPLSLICLTLAFLYAILVRVPVCVLVMSLLYMTFHSDLSTGVLGLSLQPCMLWFCTQHTNISLCVSPSRDSTRCLDARTHLDTALTGRSPRGPSNSALICTAARTFHSSILISHSPPLLSTSSHISQI